MKLTPQQKKLRKLAKLEQAIEGDVTSVFSHVDDVENDLNNRIDEVDSKIQSVAELIPETPTEEVLTELIKPLIPQPLKGDKGDDYVLTDTDKEDIAQSIKIPIVEKVVETVVEKTEVIREQPIEIIKEVAVLDENALPKYGDKFRDGLELLEGDDRLDRKAIKGLEDYEFVKQNAFTPRGGNGKGLLSQLNDVNIVNPTNGQSLEYNATTQKWENSTDNDSVTSVSNTDGTLTISPTTGAVIASINLANDFVAAEAWTGTHWFNDDAGNPIYINTTSATNWETGFVSLIEAGYSDFNGTLQLYYNSAETWNSSTVSAFVFTGNTSGYKDIRAGTFFGTGAQYSSIAINNSNIDWSAGAGNDVVIAAAGATGSGAWVGFKYDSTNSRINTQDQGGALLDLQVDTLYANDSIISNSISANSLITSTVTAQSSAGIILESHNGTDVALFGAGGGSNATFYGGVNIDGTTRLATSLTGALQASSGTVSAGTLSIANGGTNATSYGANRLIFMNSGNTAFSSDAGLTFNGTNFAVDTNVLYTDATNNTVGIGTTRTGAISATNPRLRIMSSSSSSSSSSFEIMNAGFVSRLVYRDDGRLWLGTGTASFNDTFTLNSSGTGVGMQFTTAATGSASNDGFYLQYYDSVGARYWLGESNPHVFYISGTEVARFSNTGAVMQITGTLAAQYSGAGSTRGGTISLISSAGTPQDWYMAVGGTDNGIVNGRSWFLYDNTNSVARFFVNTSGDVGAGLGNTAASARLHLVKTTTQFRAGYDAATNYWEATTSSTGVTTFNAAGSGASFIFSDAVTINGLLTLSAQNIATDTTTGMKIATATSQKLGFWNATPVVQPTTAVTAATFVTNTSGIVDDTATFDGYTLGQVVKALRNAGLLA